MLDAALDAAANADSSATPATRLASVQGSSQPSAAGAAEAVDEAEQAEGAGDGAGEVELAGVRLGLVEEARARASAATRPIGTLMRKVSRQPSTDEPEDAVECR